MGLLDSLGYGNQGGYGGLLDALLYPSPLNKPQDMQQPQYDAMGNSFGQASIPQTAPDPFGPVPNVAQWAQQFAPKSQQPFNVGAAPLPGMVPGVLQSAQPQQPAPEQPPVNQVNDINVGGYQMPRMGSVADYTPPAAPTDVSAQSRQAPQQPQQQPQSLPPAFGGSSYLERLNAGGGLIGSLLGDTSQQKTLKAQYDALVPLVGQQKAMLAVLNPEAGKTILAQALEKKQYGFTKLDNDTIVNQDPQTGKVSVAYSSDNKQGTIAGPDGKPITIPEGLDAAARKTFVNAVMHANADAATGKLTEVQAKSQKFGNQMELAERNIKGLENQGKSIFGQIASGVPLGNLVQSDAYQRYTQAKNSFLTAILRDESGAAIGSQEFVRREKEMFPVPGDGDANLQQKAQLRRVAIEGMKKAAGPGYKSAESASGAVRKYNPVTGTIE